MTVSAKNGVAVVGLGYVGLSISAVLARRGVRVFGVDSREDVVWRVNAGICPIQEPGMDNLVREVVASGRLTAHTRAGVVGEAGVVILAVGTPLDRDHRPDTGQIMKAADDFVPFLKKGQAIILKSTVPPGTTRGVAEYLARKTSFEPGRDLPLACCPERLAEGRMIRDIESIPVIVGGLTPENSSEIAAFWSDLGWEVVIVSGPEEAEMAKLADNLWIDLNIALANELCILCHRMGIDVLEVIAAANTLPKGSGRVNILVPGPGVGGSCLVKDPWFLHQLGREKGIDLNLPAAGRKTNDEMPRFVAGMIKEGLSKKGLDLAGSTVAVMGLSFKHNTGDTRFSPSIPLIRMLSGARARVRAHDPWVPPDQAGELLAGMARVETSLPSAVKGSDAVVFMVAHPEFLKGPEYWRDLAGSRCLLLDCRYLFDPAKMAGAGLYYIAPGRPLPGRKREKGLCTVF